MLLCSRGCCLVSFVLFCPGMYACVPAVLYTLAVGIAVAKARSRRPQACSLVSSVARQKRRVFLPLPLLPEKMQQLENYVTKHARAVAFLIG